MTPGLRMLPGSASQEAWAGATTAGHGAWTHSSTPAYDDGAVQMASATGASPARNSQLLLPSAVATISGAKAFPTPPGRLRVDGFGPVGPGVAVGGASINGNAYQQHPQGLPGAVAAMPTMYQVTTSTLSPAIHDRVDQMDVPNDTAPGVWLTSTAAGSRPSQPNGYFVGLHPGQPQYGVPQSWPPGAPSLAEPPQPNQGLGGQVAPLPSQSAAAAAAAAAGTSQATITGGTLQRPPSPPTTTHTQLGRSPYGLAPSNSFSLPSSSPASQRLPLQPSQMPPQSPHYQQHSAAGAPQYEHVNAASAPQAPASGNVGMHTSTSADFAWHRQLSRSTSSANGDPSTPSSDEPFSPSGNGASSSARDASAPHVAAGLTNDSPTGAAPAGAANAPPLEAPSVSVTKMTHTGSRSEGTSLLRGRARARGTPIAGRVGRGRGRGIARVVINNPDTEAATSMAGNASNASKHDGASSQEQPGSANGGQLTATTAGGVDNAVTVTAPTPRLDDAPNGLRMPTRDPELNGDRLPSEYSGYQHGTDELALGEGVESADYNRSAMTMVSAYQGP